MSKELIIDPMYGYLRFKELPSAKEVEEFYQKEYYSTKHKQFNDSNKASQEKDKQFNRQRFTDYFSILKEKLGSLEGKSLFDFGCGYGEMLLFAKEQGMEVSGIEVAPDAVEYLKTQGINVFLSDINVDFNKLNIQKKFDIVYMSAVLEHLREPAKILMDIRKHLLSPEGVLVIGVPNEFNVFQTTANKLYQLNEWWISYPEHINYFSCDTLKKLLEATGYEIADIISSFPLEMFMLMGDVYVGNSEVGAMCHQKRCLFEQNLRDNDQRECLLDFYRALAKCNLGREIVCFASVDKYTQIVESKKLES